MTVSLRVMSGCAAIVAATGFLVAAPLTSAAHAATPQCDGQAATIVGTDGPDHLTGTSHHDVIVALGGGDAIDGAGSSDLVCAGDGNDTVDVVGGAVHGGAGDDTIRQSIPKHPHSHRAQLYGDGGEDILVCSGTCGLYGGSGDDRIIGGPSKRHGNTLAGGSGDDALIGGSHRDTFVFSRGHDSIRAHGGDSTLDLTYASSGVRVDLAAGTAASSTGRTSLRHVEDVVGSPFRDHLLGDNHANGLFDDGPGDDVVKGRGGDDRVAVLFPSAAAVSGGSGRDTFIAEDTTPERPLLGVVIDLVNHVGYNRHHKAKVTRLVGFENVLGTDGPDIIRGDAGPNLIEGRGRNDHLYGRAGNDRLYGDLKTLNGGPDHADGGPGNDLCRAPETRRCERS